MHSKKIIAVHILYNIISSVITCTFDNMINHHLKPSMVWHFIHSSNYLSKISHIAFQNLIKLKFDLFPISPILSWN